MMRASLTLVVAFAGAAASAQELPSPAEYPVAFETGQTLAKSGRASSRQAQRQARGARAPSAPSPQIAALISQHASANGVPAELAHRMIMRESRYNPAARNRAYWGLMQISHATARGVGYRGSPQGLLDPDTNLRYGMAYLGAAYRVAGGDQRRAMKLYASGFHYEAKRKGMLNQLRPAAPPQVAAR